MKIQRRVSLQFVKQNKIVICNHFEIKLKEKKVFIALLTATASLAFM